MTALPASRWRTRWRVSWRVPALLAGLAVAAAARSALPSGSVGEGLLTGAGFGSALVALAVASGWRGGPVGRWTVLAGLLGGAVLVSLAVVLAPPFSPPLLRTGAPFVPWLAVTALVAVAEEAVFRGVLFDALEHRGGSVAAVAVTTIAFALMHVPLYGWQVVPLDLGVGLFLGGLRLAGGGVAAPAVAHFIADVATWWL
jgi:hypothetical protein